MYTRLQLVNLRLERVQLNLGIERVRMQRGLDFGIESHPKRPNPDCRHTLHKVIHSNVGIRAYEQRVRHLRVDLHPPHETETDHSATHAP